MLMRRLWQFAWTAVAVVLVAASWKPGRAHGATGDPWDFLAPSVVLSEPERERLDRNEVVVRTLPGEDRQLAVFVATRLDAPPDALVEWTRAITELKRSRFVEAIGRFSHPPTLSDLENLALDERDLKAVRQCVPGDCAVKLSASEIESLRSAAETGGTKWQKAVQHEFRRLLIARVNTYRTGGLMALPPSADHRTPRYLEEAFTAILAKSPYLARLDGVATWLKTYPHGDASRVESFFYWSKEHYGGGKPVISVTHVGIVHPEPNHDLPAVVIAGKQIFATHYTEGALGLTMVMRDPVNGASYLIYINRSQLDLLKGPFRGMFRGVLEGRLERDAPQVVRGLRARLESGPPPVEASDTASSAR